MIINYKKIGTIYIIIYGVVMLMISSLMGARYWGEVDDYTLPIASIFNDYNFSITEEDVEVYKEIFPDWSDRIENYSLSSQIARNGGELTWYFPTYSLACIPFVLILNFLHLPTIFSFTYTNILVLLVSLFVVLNYLEVSEKKRLSLITLLSINPIIGYLVWPSAEVFIYSFIVMGLTFWYNKAYKRAAITISIAGMLNPVIMSIGFIMIFEYLLGIYREKNKEDTLYTWIKDNFLDIVKYGSCYIVGIVPMIFNYYQVGHINLTAATDVYINGGENTTWDRFIAYLFDLNFGILPYYSLLVFVASLLLIFSIANKYFEYIKWSITFIMVVFFYSIMTHINCGMTGISRYNVWGVLLIIFPVCIYFDQIISMKRLQNGIIIVLSVGLVITGIIVYKFGYTDYKEMTPIASKVLEKTPKLYNPLHSTFNSRVKHVDGGYIYDTPVVYSAQDGFVRKILATSEDKDVLLDNYLISSKYDDWFNNEINSLTEEESYISVPGEYQLIKAKSLENGEKISFKEENDNFSQYINSGISNSEEWGAWTDGHEISLDFKTSSKLEKLTLNIDCNVFNNQQKVIVNVNDVAVYDSVVDGPFSFTFDNPGEGELISVKIELPDALSPYSLNQSSDKRELGLGLKTITLEE